MAYTEIPTALIAAGKGLTKTLLELFGADFDDHEDRIGDMEAAPPIIPPGVIIGRGNNVTLSGYLPCDGSAVSRTTYAALYSAIGTAHGAGDGLTTFNVPDLRGRVPIGAGTGTYSGATARTLGQQVGAEEHTVTEAEMAAHSHAINDSGHTHTFSTGMNFGVGIETLPPAGALKNSNGAATNGATTGSSTTGYTGVTSTGGGDAHNNVQPSLVCAFLIKT